MVLTSSLPAAGSSTTTKRIHERKSLAADRAVMSVDDDVLTQLASLMILRCLYLEEINVNTFQFLNP